MSKFNLIALAVAATLAAPSAFAITVVPTATQTRVAHVDVEDDATVVSVGAIPVGIADTDRLTVTPFRGKSHDPAHRFL